MERTILSIRRRLQAPASPATRYSLTGATAIRAELKALGIRSLPCERTIERVLQRNGLTAPRVRLAPLLPRQEDPGPQARASNQLHEVDLVRPIYLKGSGHRYDIWVGKDAFDGAVFLRLAPSRRRDEVLATVPKEREKDRVVTVRRALVWGDQHRLDEALAGSGVGRTINTLFVERHHGTDRGRNARKTYRFGRVGGSTRR